MKRIFAVSLALFLFLAASAVESKSGQSVQIKKVRGDLYEQIDQAAKNQFAKDSNLFVVPNSAQQRAWQKIIGNILDNQLEEAKKDIDRLNFPYDLTLFTDKQTNREYVLLQEKMPQLSGWGLYVFDLNAKNPLTIEAPHVIADARTELEAIDAFLQTRAQAFLMAGTHRRANKKETPCTQPGSSVNPDDDTTDFPESDVAHATATMFHATHETLVTLRPKTIAVQLHGMIERDVCPHAFISTGTTTVTSNSKQLLSCMTKNKVEAGIYEGNRDGCPLGATTNVQGRFSNGEKRAPCSTGVKSAPDPGYFIHIEQEPALRRDRKSWQPVIEALKCSFPDN